MWGERIRSILDDKSIKQKEFAKLIDVPESSLSNWLGASYPPLDFIEKACRYFNIPLWEFFLEDRKVRPDYVPSWVNENHIDILQMMHDLPEEDEKDVLRTVNLVLSILIRKNNEKLSKFSQ